MEDVEEIKQEEGEHGKAAGIPLIDLVLYQHIMSFFKGLDIPRMLPPT